ncbi:hypothetical protein [Stenoxybacter acetivorans]|uniref:hypothetical protein n=1 Tax=Stenoxybacter acetivorans TaxID=422441 RepID=UPI0012EBD5E7|nr:hypothetical protein [Stenoxybacter acetivorans]
MNKKTISPEIKERTVRLYQEQQHHIRRSRLLWPNGCFLHMDKAFHFGSYCNRLIV